MDSLIARYLAVAGGGDRALEVEPLQAFIHDDPQRQAEVLSRLETAPDVTLQLALYTLLSFGGDLEEIERVAGVFTLPQRAPWMQALGHLVLAYGDLGSGRVRAGLAQIEQARGLSPPAFVTYYAALARLLPWVPTTDAELEELLAEATALPRSATIGAVNSGRDHEGVEPYVREVLIGLLEARLGRTPAARAAVIRLDAMGGTTFAHTLGEDLARTVEGYDRWVSADTIGALESFESMPMEANYALMFVSELYSHGFARYQRARALQATGRGAEADGWYRGLYMSPFEIAFRGPALLHRAEIRAKSGDRQGAVHLYREFLEYWKDADPELRPMVEEARAALARLER